MTYSWPSAGNAFSYRADRAKITEPVVADLQLFLTALSRNTGADKVHVIAHSMGNEFLIRAMQALAETDPPEPYLDQVVFASPDVDAVEFSQAVSAIGNVAENLTLYASSKDKALQASQRYNRSNSRAGDAGSPVVLDGLNTVDTTVVSEGNLGHSDIFGAAFADFQAVLWHSFAPEERCVLSRKTLSSGTSWVFGIPRESYCGQNEFSTAMTTLRRLGPQRAAQALETRAETDSGSASSRWRSALEIIRSLR